MLKSKIITKLNEKFKSLSLSDTEKVLNLFLDKISKMHFGYRTIFTWYMWRSIDSGEVEY